MISYWRKVPFLAMTGLADRPCDLASKEGVVDFADLVEYSVLRVVFDALAFRWVVAGIRGGGTRGVGIRGGVGRPSLIHGLQHVRSRIP
jgi:hypothetical protein